MDFTSVLALKSLFFANRARNSVKQAQEGQKCASAANAARCAITASQTVVPLFAVSKCLAATAESPAIRGAAEKLTGGNLEKIALAMTSDTTKSALKGMSSVTAFLAKLGLVGNITYAAAKCMDAKEEDKTKVFMQASGNCAGMYLCEHLYSKAVSQINPDDVSKSVEAVSKKIPKGFKYLKSVKPGSVLVGIGFVVASLFGCWAGEKLGDKVYSVSLPNHNSLVPEPVTITNNQNVNMIA